MAVEDLRALCDAHDVRYEPHMGPGKLCMELYDALVEPTLVAPTFVTNQPREVSPLARVDRHDPDLVERFELVGAGRELANAYSELNDPVDQRRRVRGRAAGQGGGRRRGRQRRRGLPPGPRVRHAARPAAWASASTAW